MRYYVYLSETKIEMLHGQIPSAAREDVAAELKVNLGVVSSSVKGGQRSTQQRRVLAIEKYLKAERMVGTVDEPGAYFEGTLSMRWGPIDRGPTVLFTGSTEGTVLALGGSIGHVLGGAPPDATVGYVSSAPFLVAALCEEVPSLALTEADERNMEALLSRGRDARVLALAMVDYANEWMRGPEQRLTFLAKRLLWSGDDPELPNAPRSGRRLLLGTPVYVAQAD